MTRWWPNFSNEGSYLSMLQELQSCKERRFLWWGGEWVTLGSLHQPNLQTHHSHVEARWKFPRQKKIQKTADSVMWVRLRGFDVSQREDSFPDTWEICVKSGGMPGMVQNLVNSGKNYQWSIGAWVLPIKSSSIEKCHDVVVIWLFGVIGILP